MDEAPEKPEEKGALAVLPFAGTIKATAEATAADVDTSAPPADVIGLEYVYGVRVHDTRNNVRYLRGVGNAATRKIVYNAAALGIALDIPSKDQVFNRSHGDDIVSGVQPGAGHRCLVHRASVPAESKGAHACIWEGIHEAQMQMVEMVAVVHFRLFGRLNRRMRSVDHA